jgi:hypothetical protein
MPLQLVRNNFLFNSARITLHCCADCCVFIIELYVSSSVSLETLVFINFFLLGLGEESFDSSLLVWVVVGGGSEELGGGSFSFLVSLDEEFVDFLFDDFSCFSFATVLSSFLVVVWKIKTKRIYITQLDFGNVSKSVRDLS